MTATTANPTMVFARWARRRRGWNDYFCLNFRLPSGEAVGIGAPTIAQAHDFALSEFARLTNNSAVLVIPLYRGHKGA